MDPITHMSPHVDGEIHLGGSPATCHTCQRRVRDVQRLIGLTAARLALADQELLEHNRRTPAC